MASRGGVLSLGSLAAGLASVLLLLAHAGLCDTALAAPPPATTLEGDLTGPKPAAVTPAKAVPQSPVPAAGRTPAPRSGGGSPAGVAVAPLSHPGTLALLGFALTALGLLRRRFRKPRPR